MQDDFPAHAPRRNRSTIRASLVSLAKMGDRSEGAEELAEQIGSSDAERKLMEALLRLGLPPERIRATAKLGPAEEAIFGGVLDPERERRRVSAVEIEADGGLTVEEIQAMLRGFGLALPAADEPAFTSAEAEVFRELGRLGEMW
ncbi:MAG: hypothetical protein ACXWZP_10050, partial [Gaiellaceae bacterium]